MNRRRTIGGIVLLAILFPVLVLLFIPTEQVQGLLQRSLARQGYTLTMARFGRAFPVGFCARGVELADQRGTLLACDRLTVRPALVPLLTGVVAVSAAADIAGGSCNVTWKSGSRGGVAADIRGVRLEEIPFFRTVAGAAVKGGLRGEIRLDGAAPRMNGFIKMEIKGAELADLKIGEMPLPSAAYDTVQGMLRVKEGRGRLESLTFSGNGLYARLSGQIPLAPSAPLDISLELMPKADLLEKQKFVFLLLVKYLDSPGHYRIPIHGTLAKPAVF